MEIIQETFESTVFMLAKFIVQYIQHPEIPKSTNNNLSQK